MNRIALKLTVVLVLGALLAACSGSRAQGGALTVEAQEFQFSPATVEVVAGQPVKLAFKNTGTVEHDFSVMEMAMEGAAHEEGAEHDMAGMPDLPALHVAAMAGQSGSLEFTPAGPGTYEFFCSVPGHKRAGMVGTLVVRAP
jgi:uncharacterized cupredoxin-like copper-binding protein